MAMILFRYSLLWLSLLAATVLSAAAQHVATAEYFWDTDPGQGGGTTLTAQDGSFDEILESIVGNGIGLPVANGVHTFNIRVQDTTGTWGPLFKTVVSVEPSLLTVRDVKVTAGEYFWDTDPGQGNGAALIAFNGNFDEAVESVVQNTAVPSQVGPHTFNMRVKDVANNWGPVFSVVVSIDSTISSIRDIKVIAGEYFWDTDPGQGNGTALIALDGNFDEAVESVVQNTPVPSLVGPHTFNMRVKDVENSWGPVFSVVVSVDSTISSIRDIKVIAGEYFWDTDPGQGNGTALIAFDGNFDEAVESVVQNAPVPSLVGAHTFNMRVKDIENTWGAVFSVVVSIDSTISSIRDIKVIAGEYFWDTDPGQGNGTPLIALDGNFDEAIESAVQNAPVPITTGPHTFNMRVKDVENTWGPVFSVVVSIDSAISTIRDIKVIMAEYFFNNDPGQGNGSPMIALDGNLDESVESLLGAGIPIPVNAGINVLRMRVKDVANKWGPVFSVVVNIDTTIFPCDSLMAAFTPSSYFAYEGHTISLTNTSLFGMNFEWQANGLPFSTDTNTTYQFDSAGIYTISLIAENTGCYDTASIVIAAGPAQFQKTYGQSQAEEDGCVTITSDGGYFTAYTAQGIGQSGSIVFSKLDVFGNIEWIKSSDGARHDQPVAVLQAPDGGYYISGNTSSFSSGPGVFDVFLIRTDSLGNVQWRKTYGAALSDMVQDIAFSSDGSIGLVGYTENSGGNNTDVMLLKVSTSGTLLWSMRYGSTDKEEGYTLSGTSDGGFAIGASHRPNGTALFYPYIIKTSSTGTMDWSVTLPGSSTMDQIKGIAQTNDGGYICTGVTYSYGVGSGDAVLLKLTSGGSLSWSKAYGTSGLDQAEDVIINADGGYTLTGFTANGGFGGKDNFLLNTDANGTVQWTMAYGAADDEQAFSLGQALDKGYILGGNTASFAPNPDFYLIRTDSMGNSGCQEQAVNFTTSSFSPFTGSLNQSNALSLTENSITFSSVSNPVSVNAPCAPTNCVNVQTSLDTTLCFGGSFMGHNVSGVYRDTVALLNGCDSIHMLTLTILPQNNTTVNISICQGESYAGHSSSGQYTDLYADVNGCDSTRTLNLTVLPVITTTISTTICFGATYENYTISGQYIDTLTAGNGCDSIRTLNLTVRPQNVTTVNASICPGQSYAGHTTAGQYVDTYTDQYGCDSTRTLNLSVSSSINITVDTTVCFGGMYESYTASGQYIDTFTANGGCDSIRTLNLTVLSQINSTVSETICQGQSYDGYTATGTYTDTITASNGCDSIRTLNLTVLPAGTATISQTICQGDNFEGYTSTGQYMDTFSTGNGCDSIRTLNLTVLTAITTSQFAAICPGDSILLGGDYQNTAGTYHDTLVANGGCDSIVSTTLTIYPQLNAPNIIANGNVLSVNSGLAGYQWYQNGSLVAGANSYSLAVISNGNYTVIVTDANGCSVSSNPYNYTGVGVSEVVAGGITIYPNPTERVLFVEVNLTDKTVLELYSTTGQLLLNEEVNAAGTYALDMEEFAAGIYYLKAHSANNLYTLKVFRSR